jgi:hypothetical protein
MIPEHMLTRKLFTELYSNKNNVQKRAKFKNKILNYISNIKPNTK